MRINRAYLVAFLWVLAGFGVTLATTLEENFITKKKWVPGIQAQLRGDTIKEEHESWHALIFRDILGNSTQGRDFLEFHRELVAQSDDFRIFGMDADGNFLADPVAIPILALDGATLKFEHTGGTGFLGAGSCTRPAGDDIRLDPDGTGCLVASYWVPKTADLVLGTLEFHNYDINQLGLAMEYFHDSGHGSMQRHNPSDMNSNYRTTRDSAFFQWHRNIDNIFADWVVGQYQLAGRTGRPIFFGVATGAQGVPGSALYDRSREVVYQGYNPPPTTQYGASPRIGSDIYVSSNVASHAAYANKNLLFTAGIRQWNDPLSPNTNYWDVDAWSVLNPSGNGWYFSVTMGSTGAAGTAVQRQAAKGGDVFDSTGGGDNVMCRSEADLGLATTDELDALEIDRDRRVQGTNDNLPRRTGIYDRPAQWFSLKMGTTFGVTTATSVAVTQNDILRFNEDGDLVIDVSGAADLGLVPADDLDALAIVDTDNSNTLSTGDLIYYSLTSASPSAASGANILCWPVGGGICAGVGFAALGLLAGDDLDALDVRRGACGGGGGGGSLASSKTDPSLQLTDFGACCLPGGSCLGSQQEAACQSAGGYFTGRDTTCTSGLCGSPLGACCRSNGTCTENLLQSSCAATGGTFVGEESVCATAQCPSAPGACCASSGNCTVVTDRACLLAAGTFRGPGTTCPPVPACPVAPSNDECTGAIAIPYNFTSGYQPPSSDNRNATVPPYFQPKDPPYSCHDPLVFAGPHGSGTIWFSYTVPPGSPPPVPRRSIVLSTSQAAQLYPSNGAGDTRLAMFYAPNNDCSVLQEVACADNVMGSTSPDAAYAPLRYDSPAPGKYYIMVSTVYTADRGPTYLNVTDPPAITTPPPTPQGPRGLPLSKWGLAILSLVLMGAGAMLLRMWRNVSM